MKFSIQEKKSSSNPIKKKFAKLINNLLKVILLVSVLLFIYTHFKKDDLPSDERLIDASLFTEPIQGELNMDPFEKEVEGYTYKIHPQFNYELYGLVVSLWDSRSWIDLSHEDDPLNAKDLCVIWGENVKNTRYQNLKFSHGEWTCWADPSSSYKEGDFNPNQLSNNHILYDNENILKLLKKISVGDQVYFKGYLVSYEIPGFMGKRGTSTTRTDSGQGACETVYVTELKILKEGNVLFKQINLYSGYVCIIIVLFSIIRFLWETKKESSLI